MIELDGHSLSPEDAEVVVLGGEKVTVSPQALFRVEASHQALLGLLAQGKPIYGVNTGVGNLSSTSISPDKLGCLQKNLVRSHALGVGQPLPDEAVRGMLLFRLNSFLKGLSGVRPALIELILGMLNTGVYPVIPEQGSVGSSGDLVPLAHLALVLIGEGRARFQGEELPGGEALAKAGLSPVSLGPKEGLALLNGTAYMLSLLFLAWVNGWRAFRAALSAAALSFQALRGRTEALDEHIHAARPHPGQVQVAAWLRELVRESELTDTYNGDVQDPYSLRCLPQILGPVLEALWAVEGRLRIEMNSATDNPLILPEGKVLSGGNFHGEALAFACETLAVALSELGAACERRIDLLLNARNRGLPPFLALDAGTCSGLMLVQYTAAAITGENKVLAHPAAVDSIPTSGGKEDHNAMGATSAWKALRIAANVISQVALELLCVRWAVALAGSEKLSPCTRPFYEQLSALIPPPGDDRYLGDVVAALAQAVKRGEVIADEL